MNSTLLIDFSQLMIAGALDFHTKEKEQPNIALLRHIALNNIISLKDRLKPYSKEIVLCFDNRDYWRRDIFPEYKQHRKKEHDKSKFDWNAFFESLTELKEEFKHNLPFKVIEIDKAEADDIIAAICLKYGNDRDIVIVSSDKDFLQLQHHGSRIRQYSNYHKKYIDSCIKEYNLFEHIVKGDASDGIPNILSDDDTYLTEGKRSKPIRKTTIEAWTEYKNSPEYFCESVDVLKKFDRNKKLIDLTYVPEYIQEQALDVYENTPTNNNAFFNYMVKHKLVKIMEKYS